MKKTIKRGLLILLILSMLMTISACINENTTENEDDLNNNKIVENNQQEEVATILTQDFKGVQGIVFENEKVKAVILPSIGGKVASFYSKETGFELLFQNKEEEYSNPDIYANFGNYDAAGFDDAFPTIDKGTVEVGDEMISYPDHGETWTSDFEYEIVDNTLIMSYESKILSYTYKKSIRLEGTSLLIDYKIENTSDISIPCIWAMHCLINCEDDMELIFPEGTKEVLNLRSQDVFEYIEPLSVNPASSKSTAKYYVNGEVSEGSCSAYYPTNDVMFTANYDKEKLPYLGLWITSGGYRGDYNCAFEPTNGFYDKIDRAMGNDKLYYLEKSTPLEFQIEMVLEKGRGIQ